MIHVTVYNLSVCLQTNEQKLIDHIEKFLSSYYTIKGQAYGTTQGTPDKQFVSKLGVKGVYFLHINQFRHLLHYLGSFNYDLSNAVRDNQKDYSVTTEDYKVREGWNLREDQVPVCNFITDVPKGSKMISMQTGKGKTFVALNALAKVNMRLAIVILPTYVDKWVMDITTIHEAQSTDVMVIQGSKALKALVHMAKNKELTAKYFIFSSRTMQDYITAYETDMETCLELYGVHPIELFPLLGVGSLLVDETHQHFHAIYKILIHTNVKLQVGLSATLISDDSVVSYVHKVVYPPETIYDSGELDKYTDVYALAYCVPVDHIRNVKTTNYGSKNYSHTAFEVSITKNPNILRFYTSLIDNTLRDFYIDKYEDKDKALIFVATVKLATILAERYTKMYPDKIVRRYCESDPFTNITEGEIIVTTVISAGTAIDIPDLRVVVQTVSISSSVSNIQTLGRLRKLKDNKDTRFCYLYAENLPKQRQYHHRRLELFHGRVSSHRSFKARHSG